MGVGVGDGRRFLLSVHQLSLSPVLTGLKLNDLIYFFFK